MNYELITQQERKKLLRELLQGLTSLERRLTQVASRTAAQVSSASDLGIGNADKYNDMGKENKTQEKALLATLARLGGNMVQDDAIKFEGTEIRLPATMTPRGAIKFIQKHIEQEEEVTDVSQTFLFRPWDGAYCLQLALKKMFGTTGIAKATYSMFGKNPPQLISIDVGLNQKAQVPWGQVDFPPLEGTLILGAASHPEFGQVFALTVRAPRKYAAHIQGLFVAVTNELEESSIYRGKCINGGLNFIDPYSVDKRKVVYTEDVTRQLDANIWSLLRHTEIQRKAGLPLKRAVLLSGPYGTGKSLAAALTGQVAYESNWTFIQVRPGKDNFDEVLQTARLYQPCVVFYEDVDTIALSGDPDKVQTLLDQFDGISVKGTELVMVLTTNHAEKIHRGMMRPGRLDAVITIEALDSKGIKELIIATVPASILSETLDFEVIGKEMDEFLPAYIKEAIDRAVRYNIARTQGAPTQLSTEDFVDAARGLRPQLALMNGASEGHVPDSLTVAMTKVAQEAAVHAVTSTVVVRGGEQWAELQQAEEAK